MAEANPIHYGIFFSPCSLPFLLMSYPNTSALSIYCESLGIIKLVISQQAKDAKRTTAKYSRLSIMPRDSTAMVIVAKQILY